TARVWDLTWAAKLTGDRLVRAVARTRLVGEGRLTEEELRILRPILGEVDPDVVSRWLKPSPDPAEEAEIEAALGQRRNQRELALALARNDWARRAAEINSVLAHTGATAGQSYRPALSGWTGASPNSPPVLAPFPSLNVVWSFGPTRAQIPETVAESSSGSTT